MAVVKITNQSVERIEGEDGLLKIPVEGLLKISRQEVGELKAYIDELEDTISNLRSKLKELENNFISLKNAYTEKRLAFENKNVIIKAKEQIKFYKGLNEHLSKRKNIYKHTLKNVLSAILKSSSFEECVHNVNQSINMEDLHNMNKQIDNLSDFLKYQFNKQMY